jgi:cell division protein FtsQ
MSPLRIVARARRKPARTRAPVGNRRRRAAEDRENVAAELPRSIAGAVPPRRRTRLGRIGALALRLTIMGTLTYGLLVGVREGYGYATSSPRFEVRALAFEPTAHIDELRLRTLVGLPSGTNILSVDLDEVAARVAADPWVARARVVRELPDTLRIEIEEHVPAAVLLAGDFLLVDEHGTAFKRMEEGERGQLPVITGVDRATLYTRPGHAAQIVARALEVERHWDSKHRPRLSEIHIGHGLDVTLFTAETGSELRLGRGHIEPALARYDAVRAALADEADKLAVVHLDGTSDGDGPDRVVASFFPTQGLPAALAEADRRAQERAQAFAAQQAGLDPSGNPLPSRRDPKKKSRLPREH